MSKDRWIKLYSCRGIEWIDTRRENDHSHAYDIRLSDDNRVLSAVCMDCHQEMSRDDVRQWVQERNEWRYRLYEENRYKE
jgi:hypothetical protein